MKSMIVAYKAFAAKDIMNIDKISSFVMKYMGEKKQACYDDIQEQHDLSVIIAPVHKNNTMKEIKTFLDSTTLPSTSMMFIFMQTDIPIQEDTIAIKTMKSAYPDAVFKTITSMETDVDIPLQIKNMMDLMDIFDQALKKVE